MGDQWERGRWGLAFACLLLATACAGKKRPFADGPLRSDVDDSGASGAGGEMELEQPPANIDLAKGGSGSESAPAGAELDGPVSAVLGSACAGDVECASGICVDGVCCETRCDELCATCAAPGTVGTCAPAAAGDAGACIEECDPTASSCTGCSGCFIGGDCVAPAVRSASNPCLVCNPTASSTAWSSDDGADCDDGLFCTIADTCQAGVCTGAPRECDDAIDCNGVARCDEDADRCADGENQCGADAVCDTTTGACASTCAGCVINGSCVPSGAAQFGNTCLICNPGVSTSRYSGAPGKACGTGPSVCSLQDTCDDSGICQPNNSPSGTPCGSSASNVCDSADTCDGNGVCLTRVAANGTPCDDGQFCSVGDRCQGGRCVPTGPRDCGVSQTCDPASDSCRCLGCSINGLCVAAGTVNSANACQICEPERSTTQYSAIEDRTACGASGTHQRCISGSCMLPAVLCGGVNQQVTATSACCGVLGDAGGLRESFRALSTCPPSFLDGGGLTTTPITCDDGGDCPLGEVCCLRSVFDSAVECAPQAECTIAAGRFPVCSSPQGVVASCEEGSCVANLLGAFVSGWGFCQ